MSLIHIHTTQLALYACFKEITEASKKRERERALANGFIYVPVPQLSNIFITYSETNPCHTGNVLRAPAVKVCIGEMGIINYTYISHSFK